MGGCSIDSRLLAGRLDLLEKAPLDGLVPLTLLQQQVASNQLVPPTAFGMPAVAMAAPPPIAPAAMAGKPPPVTMAAKSPPIVK